MVSGVRVARCGLFDFGSCPPVFGRVGIADFGLQKTDRPNLGCGLPTIGHPELP
jgi:hypothetical protein